MRRWTAYTWAEDVDRKRARENLERTADLMQRKLTKMCPDYAAEVKVTTVRRVLQLRFALTVPGDTKAEAESRAAYWIDRALTVRVNTVYGRGKKTLRPPWGKLETERLKHG